MNLQNGLSKTQVTQALFDAYDGVFKADSPGAFGRIIWHQTSNQAGWALTFSGVKILHELGFESSRWDLPAKFNLSKEIITLSRCIHYPYRFEFDHITIFGSEIPTMIVLYGDFDKYLDAIRTN